METTDTGVTEPWGILPTNGGTSAGAVSEWLARGSRPDDLVDIPTARRVERPAEHAASPLVPVIVWVGAIVTCASVFALLAN